MRQGPFSFSDKIGLLGLSYFLKMVPSLSTNARFKGNPWEFFAHQGWGILFANFKLLIIYFTAPRDWFGVWSFPRVKNAVRKRYVVLELETMRRFLQ